MCYRIYGIGRAISYDVVVCRSVVLSMTLCDVVTRNRVKTQGASLELVTTIECVAADGSNLKPCFVFTGKNVLHEGYFEEDGVL
jgi:hypothetical protein